MSMPKVLNIRTAGVPPGAVYVGRRVRSRLGLKGSRLSSKWGNAFKEGKDGTREEVVAKFERWFCDSPEAQDLREQIGELRGKDLVCWCAPLPCHGDVLLRLANQ